MMKIAYLGARHHDGGNSVYHLLRQGLEPRGYEIHCVSNGSRAAQWVKERGWSSNDHVVAPCTEDARERTEALVRFLQDYRFDVVVADPHADEVGSNAMRFLPVSVRRICIVHTITYGAYAPTRAVLPWMDMCVGVSDRIRTDLTSRFALPAAAVRTIYHGVPVERLAIKRDCRKDGPLRLLSLGRVSDYSKGVMWLPGIMRRVVARSPGTRLTIVGDGPDRCRLESAFAKKGLASFVDFTGRVPLAVRALCAPHGGRCWTRRNNDQSCIP